MDRETELREVTEALDAYTPECLRLSVDRPPREWVSLLDLALSNVTTIDRAVRFAVAGAKGGQYRERVISGVLPAGTRLRYREQIPEWEPGGYIWDTLADFDVLGGVTPDDVSIICSTPTHWGMGDFRATLGTAMFVPADALEVTDAAARRARYQAVIQLLERIPSLAFYEASRPTPIALPADEAALDLVHQGAGPNHSIA